MDGGAATNGETEINARSKRSVNALLFLCLRKKFNIFVKNATFW